MQLSRSLRRLSVRRIINWENSTRSADKPNQSIRDASHVAQRHPGCGTAINVWTDMGWLVAWACSVSYTGDVQQLHGRTYGGMNGTVICRAIILTTSGFAERRVSTSPSTFTVALPLPRSTPSPLCRIGFTPSSSIYYRASYSTFSSSPQSLSATAPVATHVASCLILASLSAII